jgi:hypothetical protein
MTAHRRHDLSDQTWALLEPHKRAKYQGSFGRGRMVCPSEQLLPKEALLIAQKPSS